MAFNDFINNVDFNGFSSSDEALLRQTLQTIYSGSPTARQTLDKVANFLIFDLDINFEQDVFQAEIGSFFNPDPDVEIDISYLNGLNYIDQNGNGIPLALDRGLIHEIIHTVDSLRDNRTPADYAGDTVNRVNIIMRELGQNSDRIAYEGTDYSPTIQSGVNYSQGQAIDVALVGNGAFGTDGNGRATSDVLIGHISNNPAIISPNDVISSGVENDYLYGNNGDDFLNGGADNDFIDGGTGTDTAIYTGKCADYSVTINANGEHVITDNRSNAPDGTDRLINVEYAQFSDGTGLLDQNGLACPGQNVVLAIDVSDSMVDDIAAVKAQAATLINAIFGTASQPLASRLAIVTFNDTGAFRTELVFTDQANIVDRKAAALQAINNLSILGGGLEPLNGAVLSALNNGAGPWQAGLTANRVVVFSDEPAADPGLRAQVLAKAAAVQTIDNVTIQVALEQPLGPSGPQVPGSIFEIINNPIEVVEKTEPVQIYSVIIGASPSAQTDLTELAEQTGGQAFSAADATEVVDAILEAVTAPPVIPVGESDFPELMEKVAVDPGLINGVDPDALVGDGSTEIGLRFVSEVGANQGTVGFYTYDADGTIEDVGLLFDRVDSGPQGGSLAAGDTASLGVLDDNQAFGLFLLDDGWSLNEVIQDEGTGLSGELRFLNPNSGDPANIRDHRPADLVLERPDGSIIDILGDVRHALNIDDTDANPMNTRDGLTALSGIDEDGNLRIAFEDKAPGEGSNDQDFNDAVFVVEGIDISPLIAEETIPV